MQKFVGLIIVLLLTGGCSSSLSLIPEFTSGVEGPATDHKGNVYAVNYMEQGTIGIVSKSGDVSVFVKLANGSIGNGIRFLNKNTMLIADYTNHNILALDILTKQINVYAHEPTANQPNDLTIAPNGTIYASDPNWKDSTGNIWKVTKENGFELLESNMGTTNGIEVNKSGNKLYVNESVQRNIWVYDILADNSISNKRLFISFDDYGMDGMRFHKNGNLFVCRYGKGSVAIISPKGKLLGEISVQGENPSNITFSNNYKYCFVTIADKGSVERIKIPKLNN